MSELVFDNDFGLDVEETGENCMSLPLIVGISTPFIVWLVLYVVKPSFVMKKDIASNYYERDAWKILTWVLVISIVVWVCIYLTSYMGDKSPASFMCSKKLF